MSVRGGADGDFGVVMGELRLASGLSLRRLGQRVHCSHGYLWELESGSKRPSAQIADLIDTALGADGRLSAAARRVSADTGGHRPHDAAAVDDLAGWQFATDWRHGTELAAGLWRGDVHRGHDPQRLAFRAAAYLPPAMRWLTASFDDRPAGTGDRLVGRPDVETVRRVTATYRGLDNQFGGRHVRDSLVRFLDAEVSPLLSGRYDPLTGRLLMAAVAETTQLAGWATYDAGLHGLAQQYLIQALRLAATAGDRALGAEILAAMSHQAAYLRHGGEAVDLARAAGRAAADAGMVAIQAEAAVLQAQGHAVGGDEAACAAALEFAERTFDRADRSGDPQWIGYFSEAYLAAKFGHCFTALRRGDLAIRFAERSLRMDGTAYARGRQFNLALLAVARVQTGEPEEAATVGVQVVEATEMLRSQRARDYLADLADRLAPYAGLSAVADFTERARPVLAG